MCLKLSPPVLVTLDQLPTFQYWDLGHVTLTSSRKILVNESALNIEKYLRSYLKSLDHFYSVCKSAVNSQESPFGDAEAGGQRLCLSFY